MKAASDMPANEGIVLEYVELLERLAVEPFVPEVVLERLDLLWYELMTVEERFESEGLLKRRSMASSGAV